MGDLLHMDSFKEKRAELLQYIESRYGLKQNFEEQMSQYEKYAELLRDQIIDSVSLVSEYRQNEKTILAEGANAALLDIDFGFLVFISSGLRERTLPYWIETLVCWYYFI